MHLIDIDFFPKLIEIACLVITFSISNRYDRGAYLFLPSFVMRTHGAKQQRDVIKRTPRAQLEHVFEVCCQ